MNKNVLIVLAGGALVAVLVAVLVSAVLGGGGKKKPQQVVQQVPQVEILVAKTNIGVGDKLTDDNMQWKGWPQNGIFPGTITRKASQKPTEAVAGRMRYPVVQGEPISKNNVIEGDGSFIEASLPKGMRAMAIKVDAASLAGGFIGPGDYVDVLLTYAQKITPMTTDKEAKQAQQQIINEEIARFATETIMQNVKVLAVDQTAVREDEKAAIGKTVTLEVSSRDAEVLVVAQRAGSISLVLRGLGDNDLVEFKDPVITDERVTTVYDEVLGVLEKKGGALGASNKNVRIYEGGSGTSVKVR